MRGGSADSGLRITKIKRSSQVSCSVSIQKAYEYKNAYTAFLALVSTPSFYLRDSAVFAALHLRYPLAWDSPEPHPFPVSILSDTWEIYSFGRLSPFTREISTAVIKLWFYSSTFVFDCQRKFCQNTKRAKMFGFFLKWLYDSVLFALKISENDAFFCDDPGNTLVAIFCGNVI